MNGKRKTNPKPGIGKGNPPYIYGGIPFPFPPGEHFKGRTQRITLDSETSEILTDAGKAFVALIIPASPPDNPERFQLIATPMPEDKARAFIAKLETRTT